MNRFGKDNTDQLSAAGEEQIRFDGFGISCFDIAESEGIFQNVDRSFNEDAVLVKVVPMLGISRNAGAVAKILFGICIDASAVRGFGAGCFAHAFSRITVGN